MLSTKELNGKIAGIRKSTAALRENIQTVLVNAAGHAYEHGDVTFYTRLFAATSGMNRELIAAWIKDVGFAILQPDGSFKMNKSARRDADFADGAACVAYLTDNAPIWYQREASASDVAKQLNAATLLDGLAKRIEKAADKKDVELILDDEALALAAKHFEAAVNKVRQARRMANEAAAEAAQKDADMDEKVKVYALAS